MAVQNEGRSLEKKLQEGDDDRTSSEGGNPAASTKAKVFVHELYGSRCKLLKLMEWRQRELNLTRLLITKNLLSFHDRTTARPHDPRNPRYTRAFGTNLVQAGSDPASRFTPPLLSNFARENQPRNQRRPSSARAPSSTLFLRKDQRAKSAVSHDTPDLSTPHHKMVCGSLNPCGLSAPLDLEGTTTGRSILGRQAWHQH